jgi:hypothetical protein
MGERAKVLDRDGYLKRFAFKDAELPDGSIVRIRALSASYVIDGAEDRFSPAKLLVNSLCDENGGLLFAEHESEQAMDVDSASLKNIMDAILELNGLKGSEDEAGSAEKN